VLRRDGSSEWELAAVPRSEQQDITAGQEHARTTSH
jgi:hypothetical protein